MPQDIFVVIRVDHLQLVERKDIGNGIEVMFHSDSMDDASNLMELIAAKDTHGRDWIRNRDGDPCYYPNDDSDSDTDSKEEEELPSGRFMVWDDPEQYDSMLPKFSSVKYSISIFSSIKEDPERRLLRSYKLCQSSPSVKMCMDEISEGDREMCRQINEEADREKTAPPLPPQ